MKLVTSSKKAQRLESGLQRNVNVRDRVDGDTPLIHASRMGIVEIVRLLLAAHADVHARMTSGDTALSEAIRGGHDEVVALLRAAGADAAEQCQVDRSPMDVEGPRP